MSRTAHLRIPFFDAQHRAFAEELDAWAYQAVADVEGGDGGHDDVDATCTHWVRALGNAGWLRALRPGGLTAAPTIRCSRFIW